MGEPVVILPPDRGRQQDGLGCDRGAPRHVVLADVQPLGVLVEHRIDDVREGLVGVEEAMAPGEEIAFEPAEQRVLREHLHDASVARQLAAVGVLRQHVGHPRLLARAVDGLQPVGRRLVRTEDAEACGVVLHDVAQVLAERLRVLVHRRAPGGHLHRVAAKVGQLERLAQQPAVGVRIGAHAPVPSRRQGPELRDEPAAGVEQLLGLVAAQPVFEQLQVCGIVPHIGEGHLMRAPGSFDLVSLDLLRSGPALRRAQHDHGPAWTGGRVRRARRLLLRTNLADRSFKRARPSADASAPARCLRRSTACSHSR